VSPLRSALLQAGESGPVVAPAGTLVFIEVRVGDASGEQRIALEVEHLGAVGLRGPHVSPIRNGGLSTPINVRSISRRYFDLGITGNFDLIDYARTCSAYFIVSEICFIVSEICAQGLHPTRSLGRPNQGRASDESHARRLIRHCGGRPTIAQLHY
jgi:hypothetical protein